MDVFKTRVGKMESIKINEENFAKFTNKKEPYCQIKNNKNSYFAVCPICDNPIQIIGLYKRTPENTKKPYGKHYKGNIIRLASYNEDEYLMCPYSNPAYKKSEIRRQPNSLSGKTILNNIKNYYDYIIKILIDDTDIYISKAFAEELINNYLNNKGWEYYDSSPYNISFMLLIANKSYSLVNRLIKKNSNLYNSIKKSVNNILLDEEWNEFVKIKSINKYVNLYFYICNHKTEVMNEHLFETFTLRVLYNNECIYEQIIEVDQNRLNDLIKKQSPRNEALKNIGNKIIF